MYTNYIPLLAMSIVVTVTNRRMILFVNDVTEKQDTACYKYVDDMALIQTLWASAVYFPDHVTYTLDDFEYRPHIDYYPEIVSTDAHVITITSPAIVVKRFDIYNIYEMFHSLLNVYLIKRMFMLTGDVVIVFNDTVGEDSPLNREMFSAFSDIQIVMSSGSGYSFMGGVYQAPASHTSILSTKTKHGNLHGRGVDHHCTSTLLGDFTSFWAASKGLVSTGKHKITWSSRGIHSRGAKQYSPSRSLVDEHELIDALEDRLGIHIHVVDFGKLSAVDSVQVMLDTDVLIGVHGAGLMWGSFMRHASIIEIFGGDRGADNRHYHNIASLAGLGYADIRRGLGNVPGKALKWGGDKEFFEKISQKLLEFV
jgi:hypothetical protein